MNHPWNDLWRLAKVKRERMNTLDQKCEPSNENEKNIQRWFFGLKILGNNFKSCISNEYQRFKNYYWKPYAILEFRNANIIDDLQGKSNNLKINKKIKELIQLLQDEKSIREKNSYVYEESSEESFEKSA